MNYTQTKVLLIEDNEGDRRFLKDVLHIACPAKYEITEASTLNEGMGLLTNASFDIVLTAAKLT